MREQALKLLLRESLPANAAEVLSSLIHERLGLPDQVAAEELHRQTRRLLPKDSPVAACIERRRSFLAERASVPPDPAGSDRHGDHSAGTSMSDDWVNRLPLAQRLADLRHVSDRQAPAGEPTRETGPPGRVPGTASDVAGIDSEGDPAPKRIPEAVPPELFVEGEHHYIENAGLVLVWPYLPRFLAPLGLVAENGFRSEAAQERSLLLLQHLVTGGESWPEHELLLNKLLCGWPAWDPVDRDIDLSDRERAERSELLEAVIGHWRILKGTSTDGFRSSVLEREGRLSPQETGWHLLVARRGHDVLLESLPWGVGIVRLPWMPAPVYVEW